MTTRFVYSFGYWRDTLTGERQPAHSYNRALFGLGFAGGPMHADDCKGCAWYETHASEIESQESETRA